MWLDRRPATEADIPFLLALRRETMDAYLAASGDSIDDDAHRVRLLYRFDCAEVLLRDGDPIGMLKLRRSSQAWEIVQIQLRGDVQGQGVGRALIEGILADAAAAGATVRLSVLKANPARKLYGRLGFEIVGEDVREYHMRWVV